MAEKNDKKSNGAGKFFVGALIGTLVGAVASRFVSVSIHKDEDFDDFDDEECDCEECECKKHDEIEEEVEKTEDKKAKTAKKSDK